jgi:hypothetical protein
MLPDDQIPVESPVKTGKPTTGSSGMLPDDLLASNPTIRTGSDGSDNNNAKPSKTNIKKKSDTKKPKKLNQPKVSKSKPSTPAPAKPVDCGVVDLGLFKIQNPLCSLEKLVRLRPTTLAEQYRPKPEIATEPLTVPGLEQLAVPG